MLMLVLVYAYGICNRGEIDGYYINVYSSESYLH